ncbi:MAG TPA: hypothetical protein VIW46_10810, partial [Acidimicrobiia bacterium]
MATQTEVSAELWEPPHVRYVAIAYAWSWIVWIAGWLLARSLNAGDVLYNENLVDRILFARDVPGDLMVVSALSLAAVWGPMLAGIYVSRLDPSIPDGDLWQRIRRTDV